MRQTSRARLASAVLGVAAAAGPAVGQDLAPGADPSLRLYLAATAAAEASLRLHETAAARRWLDETPPGLRGWEWRYLSAQADRSSARVDAHAGRVLDVAVSPDGQRLASSGADGLVKLWHSATLAPERTLAGHTAATWTVAFSPDGTRLLTASSDGTARVFDVATGAERRRLEGVSRGMATAAWSPDGRQIATTGWQRTPERGVWRIVRLWTSEGELLKPVEHGVKPIVTSAWSPDGRRFFAGTWDDDVTSWDTATWEATAYLPPKDSVYKAMQGIALRPDSERLAVAAKDGARDVWHVAWSPDRRTIAASGSSDGSTVLWDWRSSRIRARLDQGRGRIVAAYHPSGSVIATGSSGRRVTLWDAATGARLRECAGHTEAVDTVRFSPDGSRLASGGDDNTLRLWDWRSGSSLLSLPFRSPVYELAWSPDRSRILAAVLDQTIVRLDAPAAAAR
jgi:WD40 repeat protein